MGDRYERDTVVDRSAVRWRPDRSTVTPGSISRWWSPRVSRDGWSTVASVALRLVGRPCRDARGDLSSRW